MIRRFTSTVWAAALLQFGTALAATLRKLYSVARAPVEGEQITFRNTGHLASVGWFVGHELLGNRKVKMYDGSMVEWTKDPKAPVEQILAC